VLHRVEHAEEDDASGGLMPELSPTGSPQPFVPFLAPAPLAPFYNNTTPKLSGLNSLYIFMGNNARSMHCVQQIQLIRIQQMQDRF
jgi:hypothetical protein